MSLGALYKSQLAHPGQEYYQKNKEDLQAWFQACLKSKACESVCLEAAHTGQKDATVCILEVRCKGNDEATFVENLKPRCAEQDLKSFVTFMRSASESGYVPLLELRDWFKIAAASSDVYNIHLLYQHPPCAERVCFYIQF